MSARTAVTLCLAVTSALALGTSASPLASASAGELSAQAENESWYTDGLRDPANRGAWLAALAVIVVVLVGVLWWMEVIPR